MFKFTKKGRLEHRNNILCDRITKTCLRKKVDKLEEQVKFKDNYIAELKTELRTKEDTRYFLNTNGGDFNHVDIGSMVGDYVNPEVDKLNDKIDMLQSGEDYEEIMKIIRGTMYKATDYYRVGEYQVKVDGVKSKEYKDIFNERIALKLYNMCEAIYKFTGGEE